MHQLSPCLSFFLVKNGQTQELTQGHRPLGQQFYSPRAPPPKPRWSLRWQSISVSLAPKLEKQILVHTVYLVCVLRQDILEEAI